MPAAIPKQATPASPSRRSHILLIGVVIALATVGVYWQVTENDFINFDDPDYVASNQHVLSGLTASGVNWAFTAYHSSNWHPITWLSHMFDAQIYGPKPGGHHFTNVLFHVANSWLLFGLLLRMTGARWRSAMVAALFALHPLHVESVAWVSERKDVLSTFFGLLSIWAYVRYAQAPNAESPPAITRSWSNPGWYLLALLLLAIGLMSKPMLVTLPCVLLLLDYWPLRRFIFSPVDRPPIAKFRPASITFLILEKIPFLILSAASCVATFYVQKASGAVLSLTYSSIESRVANAFVAYGTYLQKTFWPADLSVFYPLTARGWSSEETIASTLVLLVITVAVVFAARKSSYLLVGWLWFIGTLVPVIGLVQVGRQGLADRYTYLPHIGLFIMLVWGAAELWRGLRLPRAAALGVAVAILVALGVLTAHQVSYWRDSKTLFTHALTVTPRNYVAYAVLSNVLNEEGKISEALEMCEQALLLSPQYPEALNTRGNLYLKQEKYAEAVETYREAAKVDPTFPDPHAGMGSAYMKMGQLPEAEAESREALRLAPLHLPAMFSLATSLHNQGKLDEAAGMYRQIITLQPGLFTPRRLLGNVLFAQGKSEEAIQQFQAALKVRPNDVETHLVLGVAFMQKNQLDEAAAQFQEVIGVQPGNPIANYQLGQIHQVRKESAAAVAFYHAALRVQPDWPEALNNLAWLLAANANPAVRNGAGAVQYAERACTLSNYKEAMFVGTLAAAYAEAGRFPEAVSAAEKARDIATAAGQKEVAEKNSELLKTYREGKPYHEPE